jgi:hypothetical protein
MTEFGKPRHRVKTIINGILAWAVLLLAVFGGMAALRVAGSPAGNTGYDLAGSTAIADVQACRRGGPVSLHGVGYFWECDAVVRDDEKRARVVFGPDELTPADVGHGVPVRQDAGEWQRNVVHPYEFVVYLGLLLALFGAVAVWAEASAIWRCLRFVHAPVPDEALEPDEVRGTGAIAVELPAEDDDDGRGYWLIAAMGLALVAFGAVPTMAIHDLTTRFWDPGYLVTVPLGASGFVIIGLTLSARMRLSAGKPVGTRIVFLNSEGLSFRRTDGSASRLAWARVHRIVFDERRSKIVRVSLSSFGDDASAWSINAFSQLDPQYGYILTPMMSLAKAEKFAVLVDGFRPGLVYWPDREIKRGGLGVVRDLMRTIVRWGKSASARKPKQKPKRTV